MQAAHSKRFRVILLTSIVGLLMMGLWLASEAVTIVPGSPAVLQRWALSAASLLLSGLMFGIAISAFIFLRKASD